MAAPRLYSRWGWGGDYPPVDTGAGGGRRGTATSVQQMGMGMGSLETLSPEKWALLGVGSDL
ncbi:MAG: hypothetical protein MUQ30_04850 [Anaerolineae bacterium]|nr:hypothetical protein [Anaerolineae bacterium]